MMKFLILLLICDIAYGSCKKCDDRVDRCHEIANSLKDRIINCEFVDKKQFIDDYIALKRRKFISDDRDFDYCKTVYNDRNDEFIEFAAKKYKEDNAILDQCFGGESFSKLSPTDRNDLFNRINADEKRFSQTKATMRIMNGIVGFAIVVMLIILLF